MLDGPLGENVWQIPRGPHRQMDNTRPIEVQPLLQSMAARMEDMSLSIRIHQGQDAPVGMKTPFGDKFTTIVIYLNPLSDFSKDHRSTMVMAILLEWLGGYPVHPRNIT